MPWDLHRQFVRDSSRPAREWRKLYRATKRRPTRSLVAKFPPRSVIACNTRISCCRGRTLQTKPRTGVCEPLMPDVVAPKVHQNNRSYGGPTLGFTTRKFSRVDGYTENPEKPLNCQNWGVGACLVGYGHLLGTIRYFQLYGSLKYLKMLKKQ